MFYLLISVERQVRRRYESMSYKKYGLCITFEFFTNKNDELILKVIRKLTVVTCL